MSEYTEKRWRCDFCGHNVKRGVMLPSGWTEIIVDASDGKEIFHFCSDDQCYAKAAKLMEKI